MTAVNSLSASQFGSAPAAPSTSVADVPRSMSAGSPSQVKAPLPSMASTNTSQGAVTAWRTNSNGGPLPLSGRTSGSTMRFDS